MAYTIPAPVIWPSQFLARETSLSWQIDPAAVMGPPALDGSEQSRDSIGGPQWRLTLTNIQIRRLDQVLAWQVLEGLLSGGRNPVLMPVFLHAQNFAVTGGGVAAKGAWALRANAGRVETNGNTLLLGSHFSVTDGGGIYGKRMHRILSITDVGGHATWKDITWTPLLRFAVSDGQTVNITNPECVMKLADPLSMQLDLNQRRFANVTPRFVEV